MSTAEFILAFVRFVNRYGIPLAVYSDNAKSFLQAGGIIQNLLSSSEFEEKFRTTSISHKAIPLYVAWYGAFWECMINPWSPGGSLTAQKMVIFSRIPVFEGLRL